MKKLFNLITAFGLLAVVFSACKKESSGANGLSGVWLASIRQTQAQSKYVFKSDQTFEHTYTGKDTITKEYLGIMAKETGKYQIKDKTVTLYDIVSYSNKNNTYGPDADLKSIASPETSNYAMAIDSNGKRLTFTYICGPTELCAYTGLPPVYFYKQ